MIAAIALAVSLLFPNIQARALTGEAIQTQQQQGPVVYLVGFTPESKQENEAWKRAIAKATGGSLRAIQMPVLSGFAVVIRPIIEGSMARRIPASERADTQVTTEREELVKGLRLEDPDRAAVIALVDARSEVRLLLRGAPSPEAEATLLAAWQELKKGR